MYSYCQPHWKPVTLIVSPVLRVSSMSTSVRAAGTAMATRMIDGHDRPGDLDLGVVDHGRIRHGALRFPELHQRIDHHAEHEDADDHAHPEDEHVQVVDAAADLGDPLAHVEQVPAGFGVAVRERQGGEGGKRILNHRYVPCSLTARRTVRP